jgi:ABC-2 type transport system ATP-binding protein
VRGLVKCYGELTAVDGVDLTVQAGDVYGYLGPNGAGKTTSLRMMLGLIRPTAGTVRLFGRDPMQSVAALQGVAGFVEAPTFYPYLNGQRNLELLAAYDGNDAKRRIAAALEAVELADRAKDRVGGYSHGMRQRLGIAAALLRDPKLMLLDEPATGLDPAGMRDMRLLIRRLAEQGMTVLLSSHILTEVEDVCNRVAIVRSGKIVYEGEIAALKRGAGTVYRLHTTDDERALRICRAQPGVSDARIAGRPDGAHAPASREPEASTGRTGIAFTADEAAVAVLSQALVEAGALIKALAPQTATLEDLFFSFTEGDDASAERPPEPAAAAEAAS